MALHASPLPAETQPPPAEMVTIQAGEFTMGTGEEEARRLARRYGVHPGLFLLEAPQRRVALPAFRIDRYPVTNAQYAAFAKATGRRTPWGGGDPPEGLASHPGANVTWDDADSYARWAGKRLPTAEEWEKAARGTDGRAYPWGSRWVEAATRCHDPRSPRTEAGTMPVGSFSAGASPYGVMDLCGNVAEWTATPACPPQKELGWAWYVVKGASEAQSQRYHFRCAAMALSAHQSRAQPWLGFRCAQDAGQETAPPVMQAHPRRQPAVPDPKSEIPNPKSGSLPAGPREDLYLEEPIRLEAGPTIRVPYFPDSSFGMSLPEQIGAEGLPFGWSMKHTRTPWEVSADGRTAGYQATFEEKAVLRVDLRAGLDCVDFTLSLTNLTEAPFTGVQSNTCFQGWHSPFFEDPEQARTFVFTDGGPTPALRMPPFPAGEPLHRGWDIAGPGDAAPAGGEKVRLPIMLTVSHDGRWSIAQAYAEGVSVAGNAHYSCLHVRPKWPDILPGETRALTGKVYFLRGGPADVLARWKRDFAR